MILTDHPIGLHWAKRRAHLGYVNIPKCGSSTMKAVVRELGFFERKPNCLDSNLRYVTVIRQPWQRYLSGVAEYIVRYFRLRQPKFVYDKLFLTTSWNKYKLDVHFETNGHRVVFDAHTVPQAKFLEPFEDSDLRIYTMENMSEVCKSLGYTKALPHRNKSGIQYKQFVKYIDTKLRSNKEWYNTWESIYESDIIMYNTACIK